MKTFIITIPIVAASALLLGSCEDEVSKVGSGLVESTTEIFVDSLTVDLQGHSVVSGRYDTRSQYNLLGRLTAKGYGSLDASFATQLFCASALSVPDSITSEMVDSMRLTLSVPRNLVIGDSMAPQQLKVYLLNRQLPSTIDDTFDIAGYYDPAAPIAVKNYTLTGLALSDSDFTHLKTLPIDITMPKSWATSTFEAYRTNPQAFQWPDNFTKYMPGLYIASTFGKGCIANIASAKLFTYYSYPTTRVDVIDNEAVSHRVMMKDSVCLFSTAPEVVASTLFKYTPAPALEAMIQAGKSIITTPMGYNVKINFPADRILSSYMNSATSDLSTINDLTFSIPAESVGNDYGLGVPGYLLLIPTSEIGEFFANGKVPDQTTTFAGSYNSSKGAYEFSSMRQWLVNLVKSGHTPTPAECDFTLIPVDLTIETQVNSDGSKTLYTTGCSQYINTPCMVRLHTDRASAVFTYTRQSRN